MQLITHRVPVIMLFLTLMTAACGARVTVETGEVAKVLGTSGLEDKLYSPGSFRMDSCLVTACPKIVRLQRNKSTTLLTIDGLFLPKSNVDIRNVQVGIQFQVKDDTTSVNKIYAEVRPEEVSPGIMLISAEKVYETFLARKAPDAIVMALREHTVDQVLTEIPEVAERTKQEINKMLEDAPIEVTELGFPNGIGEVPKEVISAKRRLFAIEEEKARQIKALEAELSIEEQRQRVQFVRAQNDVKNAATSGVSYDVYVSLKNQERFADAADAFADAIADSGAPVIVAAPTFSNVSREDPTIEATEK